MTKKSAVLGPKVQIVNPDNPYSPGHPVNTPGTPFKPLPSSTPVTPGPLPADNYVASTPPTPQAARVPLPFSNRFFSLTSLAGCTQVLQATYPIPMPVLVDLFTGESLTPTPPNVPPNSPFPYALSVPAEVDETALAGVSTADRGRYIIEYGVGPTKFYAYTDYAPGRFQIPFTNFVRIWAHIYAPTALAGTVAVDGIAQVRPGVLQPSKAFYTRELRRTLADGVIDINGQDRVPPFARTFTLSAIDESFVTVPLANRARVEAASSAGRWLVVSPDAIDPSLPAPSLPYPAVSVPVPASRIDLVLRKAIAGPCRAAIVFEVGS